MNKEQSISFDQTEYAFAYKSDKELRRAHLMFSLMGSPIIIRLGLALTPWAIKWKLPFVQTLIRKTIFNQFVGGETLQKTTHVVKKLEHYKVNVILDYGVEGGEGELSFDHSTDEFIRVIDFAALHQNIPYISIKITGISRFGLLEKINLLMLQHNSVQLTERLDRAIEQLNDQEKSEWQKVTNRLTKICNAAYQQKVSILIDAEESWIQEPVDALATLMMMQYNTNEAIVYNTIQLYRHDRFAFLKDSLSTAQQHLFILGAKLVRGAYMEKERTRAATIGYTSPIQISKENSDKHFNEAIAFCIDHIDTIATIIASHNEYSNSFAAKLLSEKGIAFGHQHIHFSQLYGMSDNISFNLAKFGFSVSKYLPFGPIKDVIPYLMRRAQENSSVAGQTGRELGLIIKEISRRKSLQ